MARAIIAITLATLALCSNLSLVHSCKCLPLPNPAQCRTSYLGLFKITGVNIDTVHYQKHYSFELLEDLTNSTTKDTLRGAKYIETAQSTATCGAELSVGSTYLIGGQFNTKTHLPYIFTCHAFIEEWHLKGEASTKKLAQYKTECEQFHKNGGHVL